MNRIKIDTIVGLFLIGGFICFAYLAIKLGDVPLLGENSYNVTAYFTSISGLKEGADVDIGGVKVGKVKKITLDQNTYEAKVILAIKNGVKIPSDTIASIKTSGIIGDKYISLKPGASEKYLKDGSKITDTEAAIDIEGLISKYIFEKQ
ncbi:MAG: outer membrane lipid asymmetry maintenance protein MlaD [Dissulfurimicrobium sp.]|uniref:outer membrane lipid asymmetry maintenance protein MlaD n=1 Tax=Dissulfurimicrobium TaxID=1769732 RepID=UPI001EDC8C39|nr:outer membrane lipid asymmetry maintenance protein MlaD [Dissulfurimicrobium hydrothermale]UKL13204.1 outer membrane lipid asymmetry maintenance protein MlaD [Dissulfurimicrobium hydrothermale]